MRPYAYRYGAEMGMEMEMQQLIFVPIFEREHGDDALTSMQIGTNRASQLQGTR